MIWTSEYMSPLGRITLACDDEALVGLWFNGQRYFGSVLPKVTVQREHPLFAEAGRWLDIYFSGKEPGFLPPLRYDTTPFRKRICDIMLTIPYGKTMTYGEIAAEAARQQGLAKMSAQAVGGAVGHNPISLMIPCHRVVGTNGSLTGYGGGRKHCWSWSVPICMACSYRRRGLRFDRVSLPLRPENIRTSGLTGPDVYFCFSCEVI